MKALAVILACLLAALGPHLLAVLVACAAGAAVIMLAVIAEAAIANGPGIVPHPRVVIR